MDPLAFNKKIISSTNPGDKFFACTIKLIEEHIWNSLNHNFLRHFYYSSRAQTDYFEIVKC